MKRVILLGFAILFACSMTMAADLVINGSGTISAGTYDNVELNVGASATTGIVDVAAGASVVIDGQLSVTDTDVASVSTTLNIGATSSVQLTAGSLVAGGGGHAEINVEGSLNIDAGYFMYDGNNVNAGVTVEINVSGSGSIDANLHQILGGYSTPWHCELNLSDDATVFQGRGPIYTGGTQGTGAITMSGNATIRSDDVSGNLYDNLLNVGWDGNEAGVLTVESGNTVMMRHILIRAGGQVNYILDAAGQACVLTSFEPIDPDTGEPVTTDSMMRFLDGSLIDLDYSGVAAGVLIPGFAVDIATAPSWHMLQWELGDGGTVNVATLASDDMYGPIAWRLREKPGDTSTLQAYVIPEPTTMALLGLGGLLLAIRRRS